MAVKGEFREGPVKHPRPSEIIPKGKGTGPQGSPVLNERQERYCHFRAMGKTQRDAAIAAGYGGSAGNASRLEGITAVTSRIMELKGDYVYRNQIRVEEAQKDITDLVNANKVDLAYFLKEYRANLEIAREDRDVKAANECLKQMSSLLGFTSNAKSEGDMNGYGDKGKPISLSIFNQLSQNNDGVDREPSQNRPAPVTIEHRDDKGSVQSPDVELTPDLRFLADRFESDAENL